MILTGAQLKAKIRNMSGGDGKKAQTLLRMYIMERFLVRISESEFKDFFILKGGMLVSALVGVHTRATMDIDTTIRAIPLTMEEASRVLNQIINIQNPDGITYRITNTKEIMEGFEYPGVRFLMEARLDNLREALRIDISTGDIITPSAVNYQYRLMFGDNAISLWTYNLETLLAEKIETIVARGAANTRMRDFYDVFILTELKNDNIDFHVLSNAIRATCEKRGTMYLLLSAQGSLFELGNNNDMERAWAAYRKDNFYVGEITWMQAFASVSKLMSYIK